MQAAAEFGVEYTPVVAGQPSLFQGGAAFPGNDWTGSPAHVFSDLADPLGHANPDPVATGPFTVVESLAPTGYEITVNERYWQRDKIKVRGLRVPLLRNNDEAITALMAGEIDWGSVFIPDAERTFVAKDPARHRIWYSPYGNLVLLYVNS